jgi:hypothetical protein
MRLIRQRRDAYADSEPQVLDVEDETTTPAGRGFWDAGGHAAD